MCNFKKVFTTNFEGEKIKNRDFNLQEEGMDLFFPLKNERKKIPARTRERHDVREIKICAQIIAHVEKSLYLCNRYQERHNT
jgi:hypothetical protein